MAFLFLFMLWDLTLFIYGVTSCSVTCTTDYDALLNCSCVPGSVPTYPVLIKVNCSDGDNTVIDSCQVKPPQSWCMMYPENFYEVAVVETICTATVSQQDNPVIVNASESTNWFLCDVVKYPPPFNVQVTNTDGFYNISWDNNNTQDLCFDYRVRLRASRTFYSKDQDISLKVSQKYFSLDHKYKELQPNTIYTVDVQAKLCDGNDLYHGPWSEWSSTAEWKTKGTSEETEGIKRCWLYISLTCIIVLIICFSLGCSQKTVLQRKLKLITYIPKPEEFFKPLYHNYGGNFKEWVKPAFSEYDYHGFNKDVEAITEKQHDVLHWNSEKQRYSEDKEMTQGGRILPMVEPHCSNSLLHFQEGNNSQGTGHSTGHISIHTVTLSGEEEFEGEVMSQSSINTLRSYQGGESFGAYDGDNREHAGYDLEPQISRMDRQNGILPQHENPISNDLSVGNINFHPRAQFNEPERVSLDSFASNEQSEDGYPHVDLDTIDSGFGECSSPGAADHRDSDLFHEHKNSTSNYVKQWMICSTIQEDSSNSENKLHETQ
ncbi:interleukin 21 receptor%2C tandem duplicate 1 [Scomber scombrus]|uniref:Interleukin 21 receptor, tandem duplicate 1 n=1 Tax=Scomber scombrus TaxID=13677 RepID=A0AAV1NIF0_SCOSC